LQPLPAEIRDERARPPVLDHARDLLFEVAVLAQSPFAARSKSAASGMLLHRKYESRDAISKSVSSRISPGFSASGSSSHRNRKCGEHSAALHRDLHAFEKRAFVLQREFDEAHERATSSSLAGRR
jgi:hypothetical protein